MNYPYSTRRTLLLVIWLAAAVLAFSSAKATEPSHIGTVTTIEQAGRYTYIRLALDPDGEEIWIAAAFAAEVGDRIEYAGGVPMRDFHSTMLDRTFDHILFVTNMRRLGDDSIQEANDSIDEGNDSIEEKDSVAMPDDEYHRGLDTGQVTAAPPQAGEIALSGEEISIAEVFSERETLDGQGIRLKARVLKISRHIMGRHWVTLSDGTGEAPNDTLLATTLQEDGIEIGDTLSVGGIVRANVDLGGGYRYQVILEEAVFQQ